MKPDAIGGSCEDARVRFDDARLAANPAAESTPSIHRTALPMRKGSLAEIAGEVRHQALC
jgi:hypothetical protein